MKGENINPFDSVTAEVYEQHSRMKWQMVKEKVNYGAYAAMKAGDHSLAAILHQVRFESVEHLHDQLDRHGYKFELHMPPDTIKTNGSRFFFDFSGMKLVIWKKVMEV